VSQRKQQLILIAKEFMGMMCTLCMTGITGSYWVTRQLRASFLQVFVYVTRPWLTHFDGLPNEPGKAVRPGCFVLIVGPNSGDGGDQGP
jgi:hypothetical protein